MPPDLADPGSNRAPRRLLRRAAILVALLAVLPATDCAQIAKQYAAADGAYIPFEESEGGDSDY